MEDNKPDKTNETLNNPAANPSEPVPTPPPEEGKVDERAAIDERPIGGIKRPESPVETQPPEQPAPTVAEMDESQGRSLSNDTDDPVLEEKPATDKKAETKKGSSALLAVVVALLVALLLVGIGFAAWQASKDNGAAEEQANQETNQTTDDPVDTTDAEQLNQDVDQLESELQQLESDIDGAGLEDEDLGL